jgi:hypothetical protein
VSRARLVSDFARVELGVALWRLGDAICARGRHRFPRTGWQRARFEAGCAIAAVGEVVIGQRLLDAADRLRWQAEPIDYERRDW